MARAPMIGPLLEWASRRRFPTLLLMATGVFAVDLILDDPLPLVDELFTGLVTLALSRIMDPAVKAEAKEKARAEAEKARRAER